MTEEQEDNNRVQDNSIEQIKAVLRERAKTDPSIILKPTEKTDEVQEDIFQLLDNALEKVPTDTDRSRLTAELKEVISLLTRLDEAGVYDYLKSKVKDKFGLTNPGVANLIKAVKFEVLKINNEARKKEIEIEVELTAEEKLDSINKLRSPTLLFDILQAIKKLNVVGEEANALIIYLVLTSRILKKPLSLEIKGDSSSGKSFPLTQIVKIFPKNAYEAVTDMTSRALYYGETDCYKNKIIIFFEIHGSENVDYAKRSFQSEGELRLKSVIQDPETGKHLTEERIVEGPIGIIETTTKSSTNAENETRSLSIFIDHSLPQTDRILDSINNQYLPDENHQEFNAKEWQNIQRVLQAYQVKIPFVQSIRNRLPFEVKRITRIRRDYSKLLSLIEIVAVFHQYQRRKEEINGKQYIIATLADYYIAKLISEMSFIKTILEIPEKTKDLIEKAIEMENENCAGDFSFTDQDLADRLSLDKSTISKWRAPASDKGYFITEEESKGRKAAKYRINPNKRYEEQTLFPELHMIIKDFPNESIEGIYNPISGALLSEEEINPTSTPEMQELTNMMEDALEDRKKNEQQPSTANEVPTKQDDLPF